jgi:hypothetical protein
MRIALALVLALSATVLSSRPAAAQDLISVEPRVPRGFPAHLRQRLARQSSERLAATGVAVRSGADIAVAARAAADCPDADCLRERLGATGARAAVRLVLTQTDGGYSAALEVTSLRTGRSLAHEEADCGGCTTDAVMQVALSLIDGVQIPGTEPDETPSAPPPAPPPPVEAEVPPEALRAAPPRPEGRRTSPLVWVGVGLGGLLVASAIPLFLLDGTATCDGPRQSCPDVYDTRLGASAVLSLGGTLLIGAVVWALLTGPMASTEEEVEP